MIVNLKTAKVLSITLTRRPLLDRAAIEQLTNYDYPDVRSLGQSGRDPHTRKRPSLTQAV